MGHWRNLRVGTQLAIGFGLLVALLAVVGAHATWRIVSIKNSLAEVLDERYAMVVVATDVDQALNVQARFIRNAHIAATDAAELAYSLQRIDKAVAENAASMQRLSRDMASEHEKALVGAMQQASRTWDEARTEFLRLVTAGETARARDYLFKSVRPPQNAFAKAIDDMVAYQTRRMNEAGSAARADGVIAIRTTLVMTLLAVALAAAMGWVITRSLTRQLGGEPAAVVDAANAIAGGDLASQMQVQPGDTTSIVAAMARMRGQLRELVGQVRQASDHIATGSGQIAGGNADLSRRTELQATNLEETAASMEQLTGTVKANASSAGQARQLAGSASAAAAQGGDVVGRVVSTMKDIAASSRKIADIIGVIDGIAFQTNILALNAAVEAARAGEQGRGFAVVAGEVRTLAQRSAAAAREIKSLIGASVQQVETGARHVDEAGATMSDIVVQVDRVNHLISQISHATTEQTTGIEQVGQAVSQLDQVTQQNAALVEQSAAAADSLRLQAARLAEVVGVFRTA